MVKTTIVPCCVAVLVGLCAIGMTTAAQGNAEHGGAQTAILMDPTGDVGHTYGARTTPHMYVINPEGTLVYKGGIDNKPTTDVADIQDAQNYVRAALDEAMAGEEVSVKTAPPYGCSVKYAE